MHAGQETTENDRRGTPHTKAGSSLVLGAKPGVRGLSTAPGEAAPLHPKTHTRN